MFYYIIILHAHVCMACSYASSVTMNICITCTRLLSSQRWSVLVINTTFSAYLKLFCAFMLWNFSHVENIEGWQLIIQTTIVEIILHFFKIRHDVSLCTTCDESGWNLTCGDLWPQVKWLSGCHTNDALQNHRLTGSSTKEYEGPWFHFRLLDLYHSLCNH